MNLKLEYKKASESDLDFLLDLRMKTMNLHYANSNLPTTRETTLQRVLYQFEKANIIILNDEPAGLLKIDRNADKIDILQLQIDPILQGKGIGKAILEDIIEEASKAQKPVLLSVLKTNKAQKLYFSLGFKIIDEDEHSYFMKFST
ncbi:ribosomal protein S18 acetylase RimI-like enzyme [Chryseobacterium sp. H1D6B]|uniref:GNAT family N-acetyltransferase n=1 Tax=Chryseobacterium sp. H1D6B TaxID=2940588 RepID=UPI0015CB8DC7|nr:GNAT family N-acetyltransferase [Chryseobacterium sp. H1D6B]MDH6250763.1 ribosomal protein S18 acetylase RimI-like enzyme [Chryseobacterium sp. H1D6B]